MPATASDLALAISRLRTNADDAHGLGSEPSLRWWRVERAFQFARTILLDSGVDEVLAFRTLAAQCGFLENAAPAATWTTDRARYFLGFVLRALEAGLPETYRADFFPGMDRPTVFACACGEELRGSEPHAPHCAPRRREIVATCGPTLAEDVLREEGCTEAQIVEALSAAGPAPVTLTIHDEDEAPE